LESKWRRGICFFGGFFCATALVALRLWLVLLAEPIIADGLKIVQEGRQKSLA
jgi:hypothetical protein